MAIRIRIVEGLPVALCAAETDPKPGDIYLHDGIHSALSTKFGLDWQSMGFISDPPIDDELVVRMESQKVRDAVETLNAWLNEPEQIFEGKV